MQEGKCVRCGLSKTEGVACDKCEKKDRIRTKQRRKKLKSQGKCCRCQAATKGSYCAPCKIKNNAAAVKSRKLHPEKETNRQRKSKFNISNDDFNTMLSRQHYRCLGCQKTIDKSAHIDHDHSSAVLRIRGLLCKQCNLALGLLKDDKATLRRLMAYLDYDRTKPNLYLIGSLKNIELVQEIGKIFRAQGYDVMDEWTAAGPEADDYWQKYEQNRGRTYSEALKGRAAQNVFLFDKAYLDLCDGAILIMNAGKSAHLELGYVKGLGKPAFILLSDDAGRYEVMPNFATAVCRDRDELLKLVNEEFKSIRGE